MYHISTANQKPYYLVKIRIKKGFVYYLKVKNPETGKFIKYSTGQTDVRSAVLFGEDLMKRGELIPAKYLTRRDENPHRFGDYFQNWFVWEGQEPLCPRIKSILLRGGHYSQNNAYIQRSHYLKYIEPYFKDFRKEEITTAVIERFLLDLPGTHKIAHISANNIYATLRLMMTECARLDHIRANPCENVKPLAVETKKRDVPPPRLVFDLFNFENRGRIWENQTARAGALLACLSGLRSGEIRALQTEDVLPDRLMIRHGLDNKTMALKTTKTGHHREIPIPRQLYDLLTEIAGESKGFIFSCDGGTSPVNGRFFGDHLKRAFANLDDLREQSEVPESQQKSDLKITMHSFRGFLNSLLLASGVPVEVVTSITGHLTPEMVQHYKNLGAEFYSLPQGRTVPQIQEWLFSGGLPMIEAGGTDGTV